MKNKKTKYRKCTANKGDYPCTIWGCSWCNECALFKIVPAKIQKND